MKTVGALLGTLLIFLALTLVGVTLVIGWSVGLGWLLTRLLRSFTLFEASLIVMVATFIVGYMLSRLTLPFPEGDGDLDHDDVDDFEMSIPPSRFQEEGEEETEESWFRYQIANAVYMALVAAPETTGMMNNAQVESLAIRLTDIFVAILKRKPRNASQITLTIGAVKKQMDKMEQQPYDDDILQVAVGALNVALSFDDELADIVREKLWSEERWF